jgi:hypothetical protein
MNQAANGWFSSTLLPIVYGVNALEQIDIAKGKVTADNCYITKPAGFLFYQAPATAQFEFFGKFERDGFVGKFPTPFVLAFHDLVRPRSYPPADLTNSMFLPVAQGGYGLQLQRYVWEQYRSPFPPTDIAKCN